VHHARVGDFLLDVRVGARLCGGADGRLVEDAGGGVEPAATTFAALLAALRLRALAVAGGDLLHLLLLRVGQVKPTEGAAELAAHPAAAAAAFAVTPGVLFAALILRRRALLREADDARQQQRPGQRQSAHDLLRSGQFHQS
jgi:hypothetical protein